MQTIYNGLNTMVSSMLQVFMLSIKNEHEINLKKLEFEHRRLVLEEEDDVTGFLGILLEKSER